MVAQRPHPTSTDGGSAGFASLHGKDCSYNPIAFPPSMEVRCNLLGQCICPWRKIDPCIFRTSHVHVGRMDGSRTTHMYRTYGSRVTQEQLPRSGCRVAIAEEQKPALRVMVVANCARFKSLAVNVTAVYVARLLKGYAKHS